MWKKPSTMLRSTSLNMLKKFNYKFDRNRILLFSSKTKAKKKSKDDDVSFFLPKAFFIGSTAGLLGSLAGMGGGFVMIPLMTSRLLRISQHQAHGTSLFAVATTGVAGALGYSGQVNLEAATAIAISGMMTAGIGAHLTTKLSEKLLKKSLGIFMLLVAPLVLAKGFITEIKTDKPHNETSSKSLEERIGYPAIIGLSSGFLAGIFGVGGGAIVVPALTVATDMTHLQALGTSLCAMTLPALVGTATHLSKNNICLRIAPPLALGSFLGAYVGARLGLDMDEKILRWGFSGLMIVLGVRTLVKG
mmetsp:Transcript_12284/g.14075  ORF Transcript_12284/g.14075 Transcript_12284/m.14075 type:complete len:304 (+) Transcript_12284:124-1035(+)